MTMNDDDLILYYYDDGLSDGERQRIRAALEADASLRAHYERLCADLARFEAPLPVAVRPDMTARWHDAVDRAARLERQAGQESRLEATPTAGRHSTKRGFHFPSFAWGSTVAATLVLGFGSYLARDRAVEPIPGGGIAASGVSAGNSALVAFERGLQVHLQESRQELVGLPADADEQRAAMIMRMVQDNRLFEAAAERNGAGDLARVLRAFEPILMRLAANDVAPAEARALEAQLTFELNVMLTKLGRNVSEGTDTI
jgi:hypothetical protein